MDFSHFKSSRGEVVWERREDCEMIDKVERMMDAWMAVRIQEFVLEAVSSIPTSSEEKRRFKLINKSHRLTVTQSQGTYQTWSPTILGENH